MQLDAEGKSASNVRIPDSVFAVHALAVIHVHDSDKNSEANLSLARIAMADEHLRFTQGSLLFGYLITFGRQGIPLLTKIMSAPPYNMLEEDLSRQVAEIAARLSSELFD